MIEAARHSTLSPVLGGEGRGEGLAQQAPQILMPERARRPVILGVAKNLDSLTKQR